MSTALYLAHIADDGRKQTVQSHLTNTSVLAKEFATSFHGAEQAELAGLAHDIGKYSDAFQRRLNGFPVKVDHSTAGAVECYRRKQICAAFAVAGHHGGLPDGGSRMDGSDEVTLYGRLKRAGRGKLEPYDDWQKEIKLPSVAFPDCLRKGTLESAFFTRMLYSCLVDADYLDTEAFIVGRQRERIEISIDQLWHQLQQYIAGWFPPKNELNRQRCRVLEECIQKGEQQQPGLFSLTVPTGGGKTVASLAFALAHAKANGMCRVIYVIPYTSIIEQTAAVFRKILGDQIVLEHHSNVLYDLENEANSQNIRMAQATENWDMPVIVTTAVQFFESLYACRSSQCRKLHNIANSVIIFDEAQMLPVSYLRPCVHAISQLVDHYKVSAVLCTATQPALQPLFHEFLPNRTMMEICPEEIFHHEVFQRVTFCNKGKLGWDELADELNQLSQVLCIVNTRKSAQDLYQKINGEGKFHLSTLMCPAHRRAYLEEIRDRLSKGLPCRVVSTSLIEAGVDVDFPAVYREIAGLDSILQAAGRCNREGKHPANESMVTVFEGEDNLPPLFATAIGAGKAVMKKYQQIDSPQAIHEYFSQLLELKGKQAQDIHDILRQLSDGTFPFRTVAEQFHLIESPTRTVYIPFREGIELIARLRSGERSQTLFRQLGLYGVSVYEKHFKTLENAGDLEILPDNTIILSNQTLYSEDTGLSLEADEGKCLFI